MPASTEGDEIPRRIVYREIMLGDRKKILGKSNKSKTGGGARDLRFRPPVAKVLSGFFPGEVTKKRRRRGTKGPIPVKSGKLYWHDAETGAPYDHDFLLEPPTDSRGNEARIPNVNEIPYFHDYKFPNADETRVFVIFIQDVNGKVWPRLVPLKKLTAAAGWDPEVADTIQACAVAKRNKKWAAAGVIDFENPKLNYCNGK
jgi:hypothetical protein